MNDTHTNCFDGITVGDNLGAREGRTIRCEKKIARSSIVVRIALAAVMVLTGYLPRLATAGCLEENGVAAGTQVCRAALVSDWSVGYCPMTGIFTTVQQAECIANGGTWNGPNNTPSCANYEPTTDTDIAQQVQAFEPTYAGSSCSVASDSGWGATINGGNLCASGSPTYQNNILIADYRAFSPSASCMPTAIYGSKGRSLSCPTGYTPQTLPSGDLVCMRPVECLTCSTGNASTTGSPITHGSGVKVLTETDYRSADGTLSLVRHYNSLYFFVPRAAHGTEIREMGTNWKTDYSKHVYSISGSSYVSAAVTYPSGEPQYFDASGNEIINYGKSKTHLTTTGQGYQLQNPDDSIEFYDTTGKMLQKQFRGGLTQTLIYSDGTNGAQTGQGGYLLASSGTPSTYVMSAGMLLRIVDTFGRSLIFGYDTSGRIVKVTLPDGGVVAYRYDGNGNLTQVTQADGTLRQYIYNESANTAGTNLPNALTGIVDENGGRLMSYFYDNTGAAVKELSPIAPGVALHQLNFNTSTYVNSDTDTLGAIKIFQFYRNGAGLLQLTSTTQPAASGSGTVTSNISYDSNGNIASQTDFNGTVTNYTYDLSRNLEVSRTEAYGTPNARTIITQWHPSFNLPTLISEPGRTSAFTYDSSGNLLSKTITDTATNATRTWSYTYNSYGQVLTADGPRTDVNDVTTYTYYNCMHGYECGQINTFTDAVGHTTTYLTYNAHGQPLTISDPNGVITTLAYDAHQRLVSRTIGTETTSFTYALTGLLQQVTLPDGSFIQYTYDGAHRLTQITDAQGNSIHYTLDGAGNRTQEAVYDSSNALAFTKSRVFDVLGHLAQEIGAVNQTTGYSYDNNGNVLTVTDPNGNVTQSTYDALNRLISVVDTANGLTQYGYDASDHLTTVTDPRTLTTSYAYNGFGDQKQLASPDTGVTQYTPDSAGNVSQSTDARGQSGAYSYDSLGRVTQIVYSDQTIQYTYDQGVNGIGRLTQVTDGSGSTNLTYDSLGRVLSKQQTVGSMIQTVAYTYNSAGQLATITTPSGQTMAYSYTNGQITGITMNGTTVLSQVLYAPFAGTRGWQWGNGTYAVREYNTDGQLTQLNSAGGSTYTYNVDSTIASRSDDVEVNPVLTQGLTTLSMNSTNNRMSSTSGVVTHSYSYDASGNTLSDGSRTFTFNAAGRMISANNGTSTTNYLYNALGQRVQKSNSTSTTNFVYDEVGHLLGEYDQSGNLIQELIWLGDIPVATIRTDQTGGSVGVFYIHTDHLNAPQKITRSTDNAIIWRWDHDPFGNGAANEDPDNNGLILNFNLRFPGQYYDSEIGLNYNYFRDYDSVTGRYIESDPIGLAGGLNTFAYGLGNPVSHVDPTGEFVWFAIPAVVEAAEIAEASAAANTAFGAAVLWGAHEQLEHKPTGPSGGGCPPDDECKKWKEALERWYNLISQDKLELYSPDNPTASISRKRLFLLTQMRFFNDAVDQYNRTCGKSKSGKFEKKFILGPRGPTIPGNLDLYDVFHH